MYANHTLGVDLTPESQKKLTEAQARLPIVIEKISMLTAKLATSKGSYKLLVRQSLKAKQAEKIKLETLIAKLTNTPAPPPTTPPVEIPVPPTVYPTTMTPVWTAPPGPVPGGTYQDSGGGGTTQEPVATPPSAVGTPVLILGGLALFLFGQTSRRAV